jgi:hypothetical protein
MYSVIRTLCAMATLGFLVQTAAAQSGQPQRRTIWNGVFDEAQAARGEQQYAMICARCHLQDLSGKNGPTLKGDLFMENWRETNLNILFNTVKSMPPNNSSNPQPRFPDPTYLDILTYILKVNGAPAGPQELTIPALPAVQFEKKTGPEPVPNLALVSIVGCLEAVSPSGWRIAKGTEPIRAMAPDEVLPAELSAATTQSLGAKTYRLSQVDRVGTIEEHASKKVQIKGNLVRQGDQTERVNLTALAPVEGTCQ